MQHPTSATAGNRSQGELDPMADFLGLFVCRGGSEAPAEQRGSPDLFFLPPAKGLLPAGTGKSNACF